MVEKTVFYINEENAGLRLDAYLAGVLSISRSAAVRAIEEGRVRLSLKTPEKKYLLRAGDIIEYTEEEPREYTVCAENIPLNIVYEDEDIIVINKPSGMVVHPAAGNECGTLVNALLHHCRDSLSGIGGVMRPGIVHRIDKDTSGLLVCAKNDFAHRSLSSQLEVHGIEREYHALVRGGFQEPCGKISLPIGRHPLDRKKMAVLTAEGARAKAAVTNYELVSEYCIPGGKISHLKLLLETGRTHQIRVHMSHLGHPLIGDTTYGGGGSAFEKLHAKYIHGQALHARRLSLSHPRDGSKMTFECELPRDFSRLLEILEDINK